MSELSDLIPASAIRLDAAATDWRDTIRLSGELLTDAGIAGPSYTRAMIEVVEKHGPYIVIAPGFALAHARPDDSVASTGLSFLRLSGPVEFGHKSNDPVRLVMALASVDSKAHQAALASLARVLGNPERRRALDTASSPEAVLAALDSGSEPKRNADTGSAPAAADRTETAGRTARQSTGTPSKGLVLTVCGNGLGTSLFLKNTTEQVLDRWGWGPYLTIEATDTISAKGRAKEADFLMTSGAIAQTLGDVGVPVEVIDNFTSQAEIDAALRRRYDV
ncbi:PTS sugar transporter subunit IIA [Kocuria sp.]|uniref:PTS sugar transporter subunit IIA n=1 Tax=Kocuria sp. TaxID=1871328 RepID=UPI0026DAA801|nr:PTS sugar transporter subunit IIA [Kocuria sp.]MDO4919037.1 PTS sugar transporter subunit IIA [Kocuria sp.]